MFRPTTFDARIFKFFKPGDRVQMVTTSSPQVKTPWAPGDRGWIEESRHAYLITILLDAVRNHPPRRIDVVPLAAERLSVLDLITEAL